MSTLSRAMVAMLLASTSAEALASENATYTYDALGRLVGKSIQNGPANGVASSYSYDPAGNRKRVVVTGAAGGSSTNPSTGPGTVTDPGDPGYPSTGPGKPRVIDDPNCSQYDLNGNCVA